MRDFNMAERQQFESKLKLMANCTLSPTTQKLKPRKVPLIRKADWPKFKSLMKDYQQKFMNSHLSRSEEELWNDFTSTLDTFSSQCIPVKTISGKKSLPWVTQAIRHQIRKRNLLYKQFKETGDQQIRKLWHTETQLKTK